MGFYEGAVVQLSRTFLIVGGGRRRSSNGKFAYHKRVVRYKDGEFAEEPVYNENGLRTIGAELVDSAKVKCGGSIKDDPDPLPEPRPFGKQWIGIHG